MTDESPETTGDDGSEMPSESRVGGSESGQSGMVPEQADAGEVAASLPSSFTPGQPSSTSSKIMVVLFGTFLIIGGIYVASPDDVNDMLSQEREGFDDEANRKMLMGYKTPFLTPGVSEPVISAAGDVLFAGACPVIATSVGDSHRAYPLVTVLSSFTVGGEYGAIVNDSLGGKLITVTNDSDSGMIRVFRLAEGSRKKTIDLWLMGRDDEGGMVLTFDKATYYRMDVEKIPDLVDHPFTNETLAEWRAEHPDAEVYVGEFPTTDLQMEATLQYMTADERSVADRVLEERNRKRKILSPNRKKRRGKKTKSEQPGGSSGAGSQPKPSGNQQSTGAGVGDPKGTTKLQVNR